MQDMQLSNGLKNFQNALSDVYAPVQLESVIDDDNFRWSINNFNLENVTLSNLYCEQGFKGQRENPSNTKTCPSTLVLMLVNSGSFNVSQGSKITSCPKNSLVLLDNSGPELEQFPSTELLSVSIPYDTKRDIYHDFKDICGVSIDAQVGWPSILKQFIQNLWAERNQLTPSNSRFLLEILDDMIVSSFKEYAKPKTKVKKHQPSVDDAMKIIDSELSNHELSPLFLAKRMGISKSYLYFMFKAAGISVNKIIIERRLDKCRNDLKNFSLRNTSVTDIAFNAGFRDLSHFCHRFKARYGTSPGKYRTTN